MFKINVNTNSSQTNSSQHPSHPSMVPKTTKITDEYDISNHILGLGINGKVVQCTRKSDGTKYALKVTIITQTKDLCLNIIFNDLGFT